MSANRWTYKVVKIGAGLGGFRPEKIEGVLNPLGLQGWELVGTAVSGMVLVLTLKKPL